MNVFDIDFDRLQRRTLNHNGTEVSCIEDGDKTLDARCSFVVGTGVSRSCASSVWMVDFDAVSSTVTLLSAMYFLTPSKSLGRLCRLYTHRIH